MRRSIVALILLLLVGCDLHFGAIPTPTIAPTATPAPTLTVVFVKDGDLYAWREDNPTALKIAATGIIQPFLAPDGRQVAFIRGQQGDKSSLWAVGIDGLGEQQLVKPEALKSLRNGHPQIDQVDWLDGQTVYFNTLQQYETRSVQDDDLYRAELGSSDPQLILPSGAGGNFAISPDGQQIAVVRAGIYDTQKGQLALLDPLGAKVVNKLTFIALSDPSEAPFYLPLSWSEDSTLVRVPVANPDNDRVALWRVPVEGEAAIFGYISAALDGLPAWSDNQMVYTRESSQQGMTDLLVADANGENEQVYDSGKLSHPYWLPDGRIFAYNKNRGIGLGMRGESRGYMDFPRLRFLTHDYYIFVLSGYISYKTANTPIEGIYPPVPDDVPFDAVVAP
ncbi:MAG: hypothetical protein ABI700_23440 [Chloroflexota bacterium]